MIQALRRPDAATSDPWMERIDRTEHVVKTPAELLTSQAHPHWLEMLDFVYFKRN